MVVTHAHPTSVEDALEATGDGLYNKGLACTCALILLGIGADLFGFTLVVTAACDLNITVGQKGILTSLPFVGILLVCYFWGYVSDTHGRRFTLVLSMQVGFVLSSLCSIATNWIVLACMKFLSVCFSCGANSTAYTIVGESSVKRMRNKYMLLMTSLLLFSPAAAAILAYPTLKLDFATPVPWLGIVFRPWRLLCIILALPSGLGSIAIYFFHESPMFLANCGREKEAIETLRRIYAINHGGSKEELKLTSLVPSQNLPVAGRSLLRNMWEQSAPLFRAPYLRRTLQLFFIVSVVYITNNSFLVWLPHILNLLRLSPKTGDSRGNICSLISSSPDIVGARQHTLVENQTLVNATMTQGLQALCHGSVEDNTIFTLIASQAVFSFLNLVISYLPNRRRIVLISVLALSASSAILINLMPEPISSVFFFVVFTCTCLGMGILASYFVDLYPTSFRGMIACLSIMVGRSSTFIGINIVGNLLFNHCEITFYLWSLLLIGSVIAAWFLPTDKPREEVPVKI